PASGFRRACPLNPVVGVIQRALSNRKQLSARLTRLPAGPKAALPPPAAHRLLGRSWSFRCGHTDFWTEDDPFNDGLAGNRLSSRSAGRPWLLGGLLYLRL